MKGALKRLLRMSTASSNVKTNDDEYVKSRELGLSALIGNCQAARDTPRQHLLVRGGAYGGRGVLGEVGHVSVLFARVLFDRLPGFLAPLALVGDHLVCKVVLGVRDVCRRRGTSTLLILFNDSGQTPADIAGALLPESHGARVVLQIEV